MGQFVDKGVCTGDLNGPLHLLVRSVTVNELQIIQYRAGQKHIPLGHIGKQPAGVLVCRDMAAVRHLQVNRAVLGREHAQQQLQQRALADTGDAGDGHKVPFVNGQ